MHPSPLPPRRIAILAHHKLPEAIIEAQEMTRFLTDPGLTGVDLHVEQGLLYDVELRQHLAGGQFDLLVAFGGDGTMLRAGRMCAAADLPLLGVNMGRFGFLTEVQRDQWKAIIPDLLAGRFWLEQRMLIQAQHLRGAESLGSYAAVNEVVVCRGQMVRPIRLKTSVDGYPLATYVADGLIAATPTGSTAYALAAGGPILPPEMHNILIVPLAPHLSVDRAFLLPEGSAVTIASYADHQAVFSVDGQAPVAMQDGDVVRAFASDHVLKFVRFQDRGYFYRNITSYMEQNPSAGGVG
jgi:NAD+ kinase